MKMIANKAGYEAIMAQIDELVEIVDDDTSETDKNYIELDFLTDMIWSLLMKKNISQSENLY